jgi:hypothetical protein
VNDTEKSSAVADVAEESEAQTTEQEVSGTAIEGATKLSEKEIRILTKFVTEVPKREVENTAQAKRLAKQRKRVQKHRDLLIQIGEQLENSYPNFQVKEGGRTYEVAAREFLMEKWMKIRNKRGRLQALHVNATQRDYARTVAKRNIVLKARQLGITTYVAARFFLNCITRPGTLCVQVAHNPQSAEEIFRIVHRLLANLPDHVHKGALTTSHANVRQIVFPHMEGLFGQKAGAAKKNAALTLVQSTISATDAVAGKEIVDPAKFQEGLSKLIDAVVQCLNAWA